MKNQRKKVNIAKAINNIISYINNTNLCFDAKRYHIIQEIEKYYLSGKLSSEMLIERKEYIINKKRKIEDNMLGIFIALVTSAIFPSLTHIFNFFETQEDSILILIMTLLVFPISSAIVYIGILKLIKKLKRLSTYEQFNVQSDELKIINSILEERFQKHASIGD
ncbi:MAG: hypothetical protein R3Y36_05420 [Spirochaetales bacterium]